MPRISPSEQKKQEVRNLFEQSHEEGTDSQMALSELVRLTTEKTLQVMLELEQSEKLGRARYERRAEPSTMHRNGYEAGTLKTAEGFFECSCHRFVVQRSRIVDCERFGRASDVSFCHIFFARTWGGIIGGLGALSTL